MRLYGKALVSFINVVPEPEALARRVFPHDGRVKTAANALNRIGYLRPPCSNQILSAMSPTRHRIRIGLGEKLKHRRLNVRSVIV